MSLKTITNATAIIIIVLTCFCTGNAQSVSGIINKYYKATAITYSGTIKGYSYSGITLQSTAGLSKGDKVLIIQMKGAEIDQTNSSSFGSISAIDNAGKYEFSTVCGFLSNTIVLSNMLLNTYDVASLQVVRVPVYTGDITVDGTLLAQAWDPVAGTGGVLAMEATGNITMNGDIDATGAGFHGGDLVTLNGDCYFFGATKYYYSSSAITSTENGAMKGEGVADYISSKEYGRGKQSNGGGGSNTQNSGGGGGSNWGTGGRGGTKPNCSLSNPPGEGGYSLSAYGYSPGTNRIFLGGGGGAGHSDNLTNPPIMDGTPGGNGGGIVYIRCNTLIGNSRKISANGAQGINPGLSPSNKSRGDGGGGGGAGGSVLLSITSFSGSVSIEAKGADGDGTGFSSQCPGPGAGGGGGVIWYSSAAPASTNVAGGSPGLITSSSSCNNTNGGGTAGSNGAVQSGFVEAQGAVPFNCAILPLTALKSFTGKKLNDAVVLNWQLVQTDETLDKIVLEKKLSNGQFKIIHTDLNPAEGFYRYDDLSNEFPALFRLVAIAQNGEKQYSNELFFERSFSKKISIFPNPASDHIKIELPANENGKTTMSIFNNDGKMIVSRDVFVNSSQSFFEMDISKLPPGMYNIRFTLKDELYTGKLLKQ